MTFVVDGDPLEVMIARELAEDLERALADLDTASLEVLRLFYWNSRSGPQIANDLGLGEPAVRGRLRRARARLAGRVPNPRHVAEHRRGA